MSNRKKEWSIEQQNNLFELHNQLGNKWAIIAKKLNDRDDGSIKNKFYSTLRKGLRKINKYIIDIKKKRNPIKFKGIKKLQQLFLLKLIAVADKNFDQKYQVKQKAIQLSERIQNQIIKIARSEEEYQNDQNKSFDQQEQLLYQINQFNKNCKKRKGKKKSYENKISQKQCENEESENEISAENIKEDKDDYQKQQQKQLMQKDSPKLNQNSTKYQENNSVTYKSQILQLRKNETLNESIQFPNLFMPSVLTTSQQFKQMLSISQNQHQISSQGQNFCFNIDQLFKSRGNFSQGNWYYQSNNVNNMNNMNKNMSNLMNVPTIQSRNIIINNGLDKSYSMFNVPLIQSNIFQQSQDLQNMIKNNKQEIKQIKFVQKMPNIPSPGTYIIQTSTQYPINRQFTVVLDGSRSLSYSGSLSQRGGQKESMSFYNNPQSIFLQERNFVNQTQNYQKQYHFQPSNYTASTIQLDNQKNKNSQ